MSTRNEIESCAQSIAVQMESGKRRAQIIKECTEQWKISARTVERYMALAGKILMKKMEEESKSQEAKCVVEIIEKVGLHRRNPEVDRILNKFKFTVKRT